MKGINAITGQKNYLYERLKEDIKEPLR